MKFFLLLALSLSILSCNNDDVDENQELICSAVNCFSYSIALDLVDQDNRENLFANETLTADNLKLFNALDNTEASLFLGSDNILFIPAQNGSRDFQNFEYRLENSGEVILNLSYESKDITQPKNCCTILEIREVTFRNTSFETTEDPYSYTVFLNQ